MPPHLKYLSWAIDFLIPRACPLCHVTHPYGSGEVLCRACQDSLERTEPPWCPKCGKPFRSVMTLTYSPNHWCEDCQKFPPAYDSARAVGPYDGLFRDLIHLMKFRGFTSVASELGTMLGQLAIREMQESIPLEDILVTYVPIDHERWKQRGFDQAKILAQSTAKHLGVKFAGTMNRKRNISPQTSLSASKRKKNLRGVFSAASPEVVSKMRVLLIDDVLTTGSTASACARELHKAGAESVDVLTVCHTVLQGLISPNRGINNE